MPAKECGVYFGSDDNVLELDSGHTILGIC